MPKINKPYNPNQSFIDIKRFLNHKGVVMTNYSMTGIMMYDPNSFLPVQSLNISLQISLSDPNGQEFIEAFHKVIELCQK
jgi:hypothetical protein